MANHIEIRVNGKSIEVQEKISVTDLVQHLNLDPRWVIVELNGEALLRENYPNQYMKAGDTLELVRPVAGG